MKTKSARKNTAFGKADIERMLGHSLTTFEKAITKYAPSWGYALREMLSGEPYFVATMVRMRIPQPVWVSGLLADWILGKTKLPPKRRGPALGVHPSDRLELQIRFVELRQSGKSEAIAIDTLHNQTSIPVTTLRKYINAETRRYATTLHKQIFSRIRKKP
jgi:hypothetical protein